MAPAERVLETCSNGANLLCALGLLFAAVSVTCEPNSSLIQFTYYVTPARCRGRAVPAGQRLLTCAVRSVLRCASLCDSVTWCQSFDFDGRSLVCHLAEVKAVMNCSNMVDAAEISHFEKTGNGALFSCENGGTVWDDQCICVSGFVGDRCQSVGRMHDCQDIVNVRAYTTEGVYTIQPVATADPFPVFCRVRPNVRTVLMVHAHSSYSFNRTWQEYRDGFGNLSSDFWLGLERIHLLTAAHTYDLRFQLYWNNVNVSFAFYENAKVGSEASLYRLTFDQLASTPLEDCLLPLLGASFSTFDNDNDASDTVNCAARTAGGFWFKGDTCSTCNPTGQLTPPGGQQSTTESEARWSQRGAARSEVPISVQIFLVRK